MGNKTAKSELVDFNDLAFLVDYWLYDYQLGQDTWWWNCVEDGRIDYKDLALVFSYWPDYFSFVEFADFAQYWMRDANTKFLNKRPDLNKDGFVDFKDFTILASQWYPSQPEEPNMQMEIIGDGNNGFVEIGVSGYTQDTQRIFLLVDGEYAGEISFFQQGQTFDLDVSALGPGTHQLKAVSVDSVGRVTCSNLQESTFNCFLNYCSCPMVYEPNKPLHFYGFYSGENNISVKAFEYGGQNPIWSEVYSGGDFSGGFIPAEITAANDIDYVTFEEVPSGRMMALSGSGGSGSVAKPTEKIFDPKSNTRALLILPNFKFNRTNEGIIAAVEETFKSRGVPYETLGCIWSSYSKIAEYAEKCNINYIYYGGHGEYIKNGVYRTRVEIDGGDLYSFKPSGVHGGFDLHEMGFDNITFAFFDCCYTGRLISQDGEFVEGDEGNLPFENVHSDMSMALRMDSWGDHFLQGWYDERPTGMLNYKNLGLYVKNPYHYFCLYEWQKLKEGASLKEAMDYALTEVNKLLYGEDACDNCRTRGQGLIWGVKIE